MIVAAVHLDGGVLNFFFFFHFSCSHPSLFSFSNLTPLSDRVLVQKIKPAEKTVGGIVLPESAQAKINKGTVVAVGEGRKNMDGNIVPMTLKVGDSVLLSESYNATEVNLEGKDYVLYREDDILAILKD